MADTDTAVLEPETAGAAPETAAIEVIDDGQVVDTAAEASPETEGSPETPETEQEAPQQDFETRLAEERKRWEQETASAFEERAREQAGQQRRTEAQRVLQGQAAQQLMALAKWAFDQGEQGKDFRPNPQVAGQLAEQMARAVFQDQSDAWGEHFNAFLAKNHPNFKPSRETARQLSVAFRDWQPNLAVQAQFTAIEEAVRAELAPKLRKEIEADLKQKTEAAGKTQQLRSADQARRAGGSPTAAGDAGGGASRTFQTQQAVDMALYKGEIDSNTARQWLAKGLPYS